MCSLRSMGSMAIRFVRFAESDPLPGGTQGTNLDARPRPLCGIGRRWMGAGHKPDPGSDRFVSRGRLCETLEGAAPATELSTQVVPMIRQDATTTQPW